MKTSTQRIDTMLAGWFYTRAAVGTLLFHHRKP